MENEQSVNTYEQGFPLRMLGRVKKLTFLLYRFHTSNVDEDHTITPSVQGIIYILPLIMIE